MAELMSAMFPAWVVVICAVLVCILAAFVLRLGMDNVKLMTQNRLLRGQADGLRRDLSESKESLRAKALEHAWGEDPEDIVKHAKRIYRFLIGKE